MSAWPALGERARLRLDGPAGALDAVVEMPAAAPRGCALICHPHPQEGGTKDNKVVYMLARAALEAGCAAIRFDFRGVGNSDGAFDDGVGEVADAVAAGHWTRDHSGRQDLLLAGFSFGAAVALRAATQLAPIGLVTVALPVRYFDAGLPRPDCPWLALHGDADDVADPVAAERCLGALSPPPEFASLAGAGHFFHGRLGEIRTLAGQAMTSWLSDA